MPNKRLTVRELIEILRTLPPESTWHGWDDGSLIITEAGNEMRVIAFIDADSGITRPK
jgi:hypothetical protein